MSDTDASRLKQLRLTRRGRLLVLFALVVVAFGAFSLARTSSQAGTGRSRPAAHYVTVEPGQTLWQIASSVAPADDPRDTVDRIRDLNGLATTVLRAGQRLVVPS